MCIKSVHSFSLRSASALLSCQHGGADVKPGTPCSLLGGGFPTEPLHNRGTTPPPCSSIRLYDKTWAGLLALCSLFFGKRITVSFLVYKGLPWWNLVLWDGRRKHWIHLKHNKAYFIFLTEENCNLPTMLRWQAPENKPLCHRWWTLHHDRYVRAPCRTYRGGMYDVM